MKESTKKRSKSADTSKNEQRCTEPSGSMQDLTKKQLPKRVTRRRPIVDVDKFLKKYEYGDLEIEKHTNIII